MKTPRPTNPRTQYIINTDPPPAPTGRLQMPKIGQETRIDQKSGEDTVDVEAVNVAIQPAEQSRDIGIGKTIVALLRWFWRRLG
ncbi:MAG: hypothetical protein AB1489_41200 [Acidobacteriota bacterium]